MPLPKTSYPLLRLTVVGLLALLLLPGRASPAAAPARDPGWPRQLDFTGGSIVIYQPQPEWLEGDTLSGRAAFSFQKTGAASPVFGVFWFDGLIAVDRDSNTVTARELDLTRVRLPRSTAEESAECAQVIEAGAAQWDAWGTLAELKAGLAATDKERASVEDLDNTPPRILFAYERAILVVYDGEPLLEDLKDSKLRRVANTPYAVVLDPGTKTYYLNGANLWYSARDPLGPWSATSRVPDAVRAIVPPDTSAEAQVRGDPPAVLTAVEPTELISTDGPPLYAPLVADELLYVTNTESDVLRDVESQALYVLLAGRWYTADSPDGPWSFVRSDELPAGFRQIPAGSAKGYLLASVAGTEEAEDAVADAGIPQTAAIRQGVSDLVVTYDGEPEWEYIEGTGLYYCVNSDVEVIYADERYYACDQGVWYVAGSPYGPWRVSQTRPLGLDDVPPSCPVYHLRYVYIFDWTPEVIYVGYLPGYVGCYPYYDTIVYGTGYRYKSWRGRHHYHPWPFTWGFHPRYNPWMSRWSFGSSYSTGFLRVGTRWRTTESSAKGHGPALWFGPGGYRRPLLAPDRTFLRPRLTNGTRSAQRDRQPANIYNRPGNAGRVDPTVLRPPIRKVTRVTARITPLPNDVYAGQDGKVYRRETSGTWKVNNGRTWKQAKLPATPGGRPAVTRPGMPDKATTPVRRPIGRETGGTVWTTPSAPATPVRGTAEPQVRPHVPPTTPTTAPSRKNTPGNLEREYRARERASESAPAREAAPARESAPQREAAPARESSPSRETAPAPTSRPSEPAKEDHPKSEAPAKPWR
jgi:hypothetical protein